MPLTTSHIDALPTSYALITKPREMPFGVAAFEGRRAFSRINPSLARGRMISPLKVILTLRRPRLHRENKAI